MSMQPPGWPSESTVAGMNELRERRPGVWLVIIVLFLAISIASGIMYFIYGGTPVDKARSAQQLQQETQYAPNPLNTQTSVGCAINGCTDPFTAGSGQLPLQLTGTWTGSASQASTSQNYPVILKLVSGQGAIVGESSYPTLNCEGMLQLNQVISDTIVVTEHITSGAYPQGNCATGVQISLKYLDNNHLLYTFAYAGNASDGQATLERSSG